MNNDWSLRYSEGCGSGKQQNNQRGLSHRTCSWKAICWVQGVCSGGREVSNVQAAWHGRRSTEILRFAQDDNPFGGYVLVSTVSPRSTNAVSQPKTRFQPSP